MKNIEPSSLAEHAGLDPAGIENSSASISVEGQIKFIRLAAETLNDPLIGFRLACTFDVRELGWLYYIAASARTLGSALCKLARYSRINNEGVRLDVSLRERMSVKITYSGVPRHADFFQIGAFIAVLIVLARHVTASPLLPTTVRLAHSVGRGRHELEKMLKCAVADNSGIDKIDFPAAAWNAEITRSDVFLHQLCVDACEKALGRSKHEPRDLRVSVENLIAESLPSGGANAKAVAESLGMSARTLVRRLAAQQCSFSGLVRKVRLGLARQYLRSMGLSVSETAWLLGYAEVSAFTKAYRRWTGLPPSAAPTPEQEAQKQRDR